LHRLINYIMLNRKGISFFLPIEKPAPYSNDARGEGVSFSILIGAATVFRGDYMGGEW